MVAPVLYALRIILEAPVPLPPGRVYIFWGASEKLLVVVVVVVAAAQERVRERWVFTAAAGNWCQFDGRPSFTPLPPSRRYTHTRVYIRTLHPPLAHRQNRRRGYIHYTTIIVIMTTSTGGNRFFFFFFVYFG